jgi:hypothetical protein
VLRSVGQTRATVRGVMHSLIGQPSAKLEKDIKEVERLTVEALAAGDAADWVAAASFANAAFLKAQEVHALHQDDVHDLVVKAAIFSVDKIEQHGKTHIIERVRANMVQEIDNNDEDSFWFYYMKNVVVFVITTYASFLAMHNFMIWRKKRMILKY